MDCIVCVFIGLFLVVVVVFGLIGGWGWLGLLFFIIGVVGICFVYLLLGLSSFVCCYWCF